MPAPDFARIRTPRLVPGGASGRGGVAVCQGGIHGIPHTLQAAGDVPEDPQGNQCDQRRYEAVLGYILPAVLLPHVVCDLTKHSHRSKDNFMTRVLRTNTMSLVREPGGRSEARRPGGHRLIWRIESMIWKQPADQRPVPPGKHAGGAGHGSLKFWQVMADKELRSLWL